MESIWVTDLRWGAALVMVFEALWGCCRETTGWGWWWGRGVGAELWSGCPHGMVPTLAHSFTSRDSAEATLSLKSIWEFFCFTAFPPMMKKML